MIIKTLTNMINRKFLLVILSLTMLSLCSCEKVEEEPFGLFKPMKWESGDYTQIENKGNNYYVISPEGGTYIFNCKNYQRLYLNSITSDCNNETIRISDNNKFSNNICDITIEGGSICVTFKKNNNLERIIEINVQSGNAYGGLSFIQDGSQE